MIGGPFADADWMRRQALAHDQRLSPSLSPRPMVAACSDVHGYRGDSRRA